MEVENNFCRSVGNEENTGDSYVVTRSKYIFVKFQPAVCVSQTRLQTARLKIMDFVATVIREAQNYCVLLKGGGGCSLCK